MIFLSLSTDPIHCVDKRNIRIIAFNTCFTYRENVLIRSWGDGSVFDVGRFGLFLSHLLLPLSLLSFFLLRAPPHPFLDSNLLRISPFSALETIKYCDYLVSKTEYQCLICYVSFSHAPFKVCLSNKQVQQAFYFTVKMVLSRRQNHAITVYTPQENKMTNNNQEKN